MRNLLLIALVSVGLGTTMSISSAHAADCANASDQGSLTACANKSYQQADAELNKLYQNIRARLRDQPNTVKKLVAAQKAWIAFRDAECDFATFGAQGGSAYRMLTSMCRETLTQTRIKNFKTYLSCGEGDLSCPVPPRN